jgi:hypothetical protein
MNRPAIRRSNHVMKQFEHNMRRLIDSIDRFNKSGQADDDAMGKYYTGTTENGDRVWTVR